MVVVSSPLFSEETAAVAAADCDNSVAIVSIPAVDDVEECWCAGATTGLHALRCNAKPVLFLQDFIHT